MIKNYLQKFSLQNKKVIILGGAGLLGEKVTEAIISAGARVCLIDKNYIVAKKILKKLKFFNIKYASLDLAKLNTLDSRINNIIKNFGCPDVFINASYPATKDWSSSTFKKNKLSILRKNVDIHLNSYCWIAYKICEKMKSNNIKGSVINFGSIYGVLGQNLNLYKETNLKENMNYPIIKGGIINFSKQLASFYGADGIRVNAVCPGGIEEKINGKTLMQSKKFKKNYSNICPLKRLGKPDEVASAVLFLASEASSYITGTSFMVDGGWSAI